jgi:hypothetical protein
LEEAMKKNIHAWIPAIALAALLATQGCASQGQTGAAIGSGLGALAGQIIGDDTEGTLIGAAVGAGIGYVIGNERDKAAAADLSRQSGATGYEHSETGPLAGTRWTLIDWSPRRGRVDFRRKTVEFGTNGWAVTITELHNGRTVQDREIYRVVGDVLIINKPGYLANYRFTLRGDELTIDTSEVRALLRKS